MPEGDARPSAARCEARTIEAMSHVVLPRRVLIVVADRRVRRDLAQLLALAPELEVAGVAADIPSALAELAASVPDVVVVDPRLPTVEAGLTFIDELRRVFPARLVVLSHDAHLEARALAHGVDTFITECDPPLAVMAAITGGGAVD
jgi:DNA-binding NarL/FixJ family response regulator